MPNLNIMNLLLPIIDYIKFGIRNLSALLKSNYLNIYDETDVLRLI